jgi:hypothetical protein
MPLFGHLRGKRPHKVMTIGATNSNGNTPIDVATLHAMIADAEGMHVGDSIDVCLNGVWKSGYTLIAIHQGVNDERVFHVAAYKGDIPYSFNPCDTRLTHKPVVETRTGTVTFTDGKPDFNTWKEV